MAAPTYVSGTAHGGTPATSATVTLPTTAANDILILFWVNGGATATPTLTTGTFSQDTSWTLIDSGTWTTGAGGCHWVRCTGNHSGETQIISGLTNSCSAMIFRISGCITSGSPIDASTGSSIAASGGSLASFNTTVADTLVVCGIAHDDNIGPSAVTKNSVAQENTAFASSSGGVDSLVVGYTWTQASAGATGTFAFTHTTGTGEGKRASGFSLKGPTVTNYTQPVNDTIAGTDATAKGATSPKADAIAGVDTTAKGVTSSYADALAGVDVADPEHTVVPFSPDDIAGLQVWLEADQIGQSDNTAVTAWNDSSAANHDASSATGQTYQTNELASKAIIRFDGVDDTMETSAFAWTQPTTVFIVAKWNAAYSSTHNALIDSTVLHRRLIARGSSTDVVLYANSGSAAAPVITTTPESFHIYTAVFNGASSTLRADNDTPVTGNPGAGASATGLCIATDGNLGADGAVDVAEIIGYDTALGSTDQQSVRDYLEDKWFPPGVGHSQPVDDAATVTDAQAKSVTSSKADAAAVTDAITVRVSPAKADTATVTDASTKAVTRPQADTGTVTDASSRRATPLKADTATATDAFTKRVTTAKADAATITDSITPLLVVVHTQPVADTATVTDAVTKRPTGLRADTASVTDALAKALASARSDTAAITDARIDAVGKGVADTASVTDAISVSYTAPGVQTVADLASVTDSLQIAVTHPIADAITATDSQANVLGVTQTLSDAASVTDSVATELGVARTLALADALACTDALSTVSPPRPRSIRLVWGSRALLIEHTSAAPVVARTSASPIMPQSSTATPILRTTDSPIAPAEGDAAPVERGSASPLPEREMEPV